MFFNCVAEREGLLVASGSSPFGSPSLRSRDVSASFAGLGSKRDEVDLAALFTALGSATSVADEAMARVPDGNDTNSVSDFKRTAATINAPNPSE